MLLASGHNDGWLYYIGSMVVRKHAKLPSLQYQNCPVNLNFLESMNKQSIRGYRSCFIDLEKSCLWKIKVSGADMAPCKPLARRTPQPSRSKSTTSAATTSKPTQRPTKQTARRKIRHTALLTKLQASSSGRRKSNGISKPTTTKRRRPAKKLAGADTLSTDLLDALPEVAVEDGEHSRAQESQSSSAAKRKGANVSRLMSQSLGSKRGVQRKREAVGRIERERWGKNWAGMVAGGNGGAGFGAGEAVKGDSARGEGVQSANEAAQAERWAALRRHISGSLAPT